MLLTTSHLNVSQLQASERSRAKATGRWVAALRRRRAATSLNTTSASLSRSTSPAGPGPATSH